MKQWTVWYGKDKTTGYIVRARDAKHARKRVLEYRGRYKFTDHGHVGIVGIEEHNEHSGGILVTI